LTPIAPGEAPRPPPLAPRRRRNIKILGQALDRPHQLRRYHQPADPPARHRVVLGKAIDDHRLPTVRQRRLLWQGVGEAMVDFIGGQPQATAVRDLCQARLPAGFRPGPRWMFGAAAPRAPPTPAPPPR